MYQPGDIVLVLYPQSDGVKKVRPGLILKQTDGGYQLLCKITSKDKTGIMRGYWITKESKVGKTMGIVVDSFISIDDQRTVGEFSIYRKIGTCSIFNEIKKVLGIG